MSKREIRFEVSRNPSYPRKWTDGVESFAGMTGEPILALWMFVLLFYVFSHGTTVASMSISAVSVITVFAATLYFVFYAINTKRMICWYQETYKTAELSSQKSEEG